MSVSQLGPQPMVPQVHQPQSSQQQQQPTRQQLQEKEHYFSASLHARDRRKV